MTQTAIKTPLAKMRESFPLLHEKSNGWHAHDDNPRFDCLETEDGTIRIHSHTGRTAEAVLAMGKPALKLADLYVTGTAGSYRPPYREKQLDLLSLAEYMKIPWQFLEREGYRDGYPYKNKYGRKTVCVKLGGYCNPDGSEIDKKKVRLSIDGKVRFLFDQNTPGNPMPCGYHRLGDARSKGYLIIGEGPSDAATMWFHDFPFLGMNGADGHNQLDVTLLYGIPRVYIIEEPDQVKRNSETGQGFYANMHTRLRENGYTGEIFSIRFKLATGYKDPSNMHKAIFRACDQTEELPHLAEIKAKFAESMAEAFELAIPEGNETIEHQEDVQEEVSLTALPTTAEEREAWIKVLVAVSADILSPAHKLVLMVILWHSTIFNDETGDWWTVDADHLCKFAAMTKKQFLRHLSYLTETVGLFKKIHPKKHRKLPDGGEGEIVATVLKIRPTTRSKLVFPSTWNIVPGGKEREHGGTRTPKITCPSCGSPNIQIFCLDCKTMHSPNEEHDQVADPELEIAVEGTANILPLKEEPKPLRKTQDELLGVNLETTPKNHSQNTHLGLLTTPSLYKETNLGIPENSLRKTQDELLGVNLDQQSVAHHLNADIGEPCPKCSCTMYYHPRSFPNELWCCICLPPRGVPDDIWRWLKDHFSHTKPVASWEVKA